VLHPRRPLNALYKEASSHAVGPCWLRESSFDCTLSYFLVAFSQRKWPAYYYISTRSPAPRCDIKAAVPVASHAVRDPIPPVVTESDTLVS